jgi:hypothetical protein
MREMGLSRPRRLGRGREVQASVTKALTFPFVQSSSGIQGSGGPICLDVVKEQDGDEKDLSQGNAIIEGECIL